MASDEAIQNLREQVERLEAQLDEKATAVKDLTIENKTLKSEKVFAQAKLSTKQAALFVRELPEGAEITVEAVREFAEKYDLKPTEEGEPEVKEKPEAEAGLAGMSGAGARPGAASGAGAAAGSMTKDEYKALHKTNPAAAKDALARGKVQLRDDNFWVQAGIVPN